MKRQKSSLKDCELEKAITYCHEDEVLVARELQGLLSREGDMGLLVSSGGFTSEVERELRASTRHIEAANFLRVTFSDRHGKSPA